MLGVYKNIPRLPDVDGNDNDVDQRLSNPCQRADAFATDEWWMRALEDALGEGSPLSASERQVWQQHLAVCDTCRSEWEALLRVESILCDAPAPPPLPVDFTARTLQRLAWRQRLQLGLTWLGSLIMVSFVTLLVFITFGSMLSQANQFFTVLMAGWDVLLGGIIRLTTGFLIAGQRVLPVALTMAGILLLLMMPNGVLATYAFVLVRQGRQGSASGKI